MKGPQENISLTHSPFLKYPAIGAVVGAVAVSILKILYPEKFSEISFLDQAGGGLSIGAILGFSVAGLGDSFKIGKNRGK